jgi:hypothetical protein
LDTYFVKKIGNIFKLYNLLINRRNCISEFSKIKKEIPEKFIKVLKGETTIVPERRVTLNINDKLQFLNESNTTISPYIRALAYIIFFIKLDV